MSEPTFYSHAVWRVRPGSEDEFVEGWRALASTFSALERPPLWGMLLRSDAEPNVFFSFGPWGSADDFAAMRADPASGEAIGALIGLCESATPGPCRLIEHIVTGDASRPSTRRRSS